MNKIERLNHKHLLTETDKACVQQKISYNQQDNLSCVSKCHDAFTVECLKCGTKLECNHIDINKYASCSICDFHFFLRPHIVGKDSSDFKQYRTDSFAWGAISFIMQKGLCSDDLILLMQDPKWTKEQFGIEFALLKEYDANSKKTIQEQTLIDNHIRYWNTPISANGKKYFLHNTWSEQNRTNIVDFFMIIGISDEELYGAFENIEIKDMKSEEIDDLSNSLNIINKKPSIDKKSINSKKKPKDNTWTSGKYDSFIVYMNQICNIPCCNSDEEKSLFRKVQTGNIHARKILIESNLKLVTHIAKSFMWANMDILDLIQEGNIGLMRAIEKYNPDKEAKFSSYASWWIKQGIRRYIGNFKSTIRTPIQSNLKIEKTKKAKNDYYQTYKKNPSVRELASITDYSERTIETLLNSDIKIHNLSGYTNNGKSYSLYSHLRHFRSPYKLSPEFFLSKQEMSSRIKYSFSLLTEREKLVLNMRYGLSEERTRTLEDTGQAIGRTRERVRQIEIKALEKMHFLLSEDYYDLSHNKYSMNYKIKSYDFLDDGNSIDVYLKLLIVEIFDAVNYSLTIDEISIELSRKYSRFLLTDRKIRRLLQSPIFSKTKKNGQKTIYTMTEWHKKTIFKDAIESIDIAKKCDILRANTEKTKRNTTSVLENTSDDVSSSKIFNNEVAISPRFKEALLNDFPHGFSFTTASKRLVAKTVEISFDANVTGALMKEMFCRSDNVWLFMEMVADNATVNQIIACADKWLGKYGCFSVSILREKFKRKLSNLPNIERDFQIFILDVISAKLVNPIQMFGGKYAQICCLKNKSKVKVCKNIAKRLIKLLQNMGDAVPVEQVCAELSCFSAASLKIIIQDYIPSIIFMDIDGILYYKKLEFFYLPNDFEIQLTMIVDEIEAKGYSASNLLISNKLNQVYNGVFCEDFAITDNLVFQQIILKSYRGEIKHVWKNKVFTTKKSKPKNVLDEFLETQHGIFKESEFFDYAKKMRGFTNHSMLICTFLNAKCIRLGREQWIVKDEFVEKQLLTVDDNELIASKLIHRLGNNAFLPLGTLPSSFFDELPELMFNEKTLYWNNYFLASIAVHLLDTVRVVNNGSSPYVVTAMIIPHNAACKKDVVGYCLEIYKEAGMVADSAEKIFDYLKENQVRVVKTKKILDKIRIMFGVK